MEFQPPSSPISLSPTLEQVRQQLAPDQPLFLVGGAVRDMLLGRNVQDYDFALPSGAIPLARRIANQLKADFYVLDEERDIARVLLGSHESGTTLDFAAFRGPDLEADLAARDFTLNAIAIDLQQPISLLDPLGGAPDLAARSLRACSPQAFSDDPIRILRAMRMAASFGLKIKLDTRGWMKAAAPQLAGASAERVRDELFKLLLAPKPATSLRALDMLGALAPVLPELAALKGFEQNRSHRYDVWEHSLKTVQSLASLMRLLRRNFEPDEEAGGSLSDSLVMLAIGRYREPISQYLDIELVSWRPLRAMLLLAALYHDTGKPDTRQHNEDGDWSFGGHPARGAEIITERAQTLRLSRAEIEFLSTVIAQHGQPTVMARAAAQPDRRQVYRFFQTAGQHGIAVCLHSIADLMGKYGPELPRTELETRLAVIRSLLEAYFDQHAEIIAPPPLLTGDELLAALNLPPGPEIGRLLEAIREAQAAGELASKAQALDLAKSLK